MLILFPLFSSTLCSPFNFVKNDTLKREKEGTEGKLEKFRIVTAADRDVSNKRRSEFDFAFNR